MKRQAERQAEMEREARLPIFTTHLSEAESSRRVARGVCVLPYGHGCVSIYLPLILMLAGYRIGFDNSHMLMSLWSSLSSLESEFFGLTCRASAEFGSVPVFERNPGDFLRCRALSFQ